MGKPFAELDEAIVGDGDKETGNPACCARKLAALEYQRDGKQAKDQTRSRGGKAAMKFGVGLKRETGGRAGVGSEPG